MTATGSKYWELSWNTVVGCLPISPGCKNCWAARCASSRLSHLPDYRGLTNPDGTWTGKVRCLEHRLEQPLHWRKPRIVFVCDMADLFHEKVPDEFLFRVRQTMLQCPQHHFLLLTKRPDRTQQVLSRPEWAPIPTMWPGVTVESPPYLWRVERLLETPAAHRWVSYEPALDPVNWFRAMQNWHDAYKRLPDWFIIGCESGRNRRPMPIEVVGDLLEACEAWNIPCWVKQIEVGGRVSHNMDEWPEPLRVRQLPEGLRR